MAYHTIVEISKHIGERVRVKRGTIDKGVGVFPDRQHHVAMWCAGDVPIGSEGTIQAAGETYCQVVWDGIEPKEGYVFGVVDDDLRPDGCLEFLDGSTFQTDRGDGRLPHGRS